MTSSGYRDTGDLVALVAELQALGPGDTLRNALRRELGDARLDIVYLRTGSGGWIDGLGRTMTEPTPADDRVMTAVERGGKPIAALVHDPALLDDPRRLAAAVRAASLAFDNEQLKADLQAEVAELRSSRARIVEAVDLERRHAERNLHDGAQQRLVGLALMLRLASRRAAADPALTASLDEAAAALDDALTELRELARGLYPAVVTASGLTGALEVLAERPGVPVDLRVDLPGALPELVEVAAYFVVSEGLTNVSKHADATGATVRVAVTDDVLEILVEDDGSGGAAPEPGSGLEGLADRVHALGGQLAITSAPGRGTTVSAAIPLAAATPVERAPDSLLALRWIGWETYELPPETYDQLRQEDQRSWIRGVFAVVGGVSHVTDAERAWAVGSEAAAGAAGWVLEALRGHDVDEKVADILALPGMQLAARGLLYDATRMSASDGALTGDELDRLRRGSHELGLTSDDLAVTIALVEDELVVRRRRYEAIVAPYLPAGRTGSDLGRLRAGTDDSPRSRT